jgi:ADP-heptose:LPS heptosyltransferase
MPEKQHRAPWKDRFNWRYASVAAEVPALIGLQGLKPSTFPSPQTVLIVNCSLIGDFVLSLPAIVDFIKENSTAQVDLLVSPSVAPLARKLRGVRRVYAARSVFRQTTELAGADESLAPSYDLVIVLRFSQPARRLLATTTYRAIRTYLVPFLKHAVHLARQPSAHVKQISEFNFEIFGKAGKDERYLSADEVFDFTDVPAVAARPGRTVVVHTGSGSRVNFWPLNKWIALLEELNKLKDLSFVFVGGTEQEERAFDEMSSRLSFPIESVIRQYNLLQVLMLMRASHLFVGVDSGPRHIAHLVDLRSVSLLGPGPKSFKPLNRNATVIDETECTRCITFYCPYTPSCVGKIDVGTVAQACKESLGR